MNALRWASSGLGLDRSVVMTLLARGWPVLAGVVTVLMVSRHLTPELQGYYFTFGSLIALHVMLELGLGNAIVQLASHEMATLSWTIDGRVDGDARAKRRLQSLLHFSLAWFAAAAVLMAVLLVPLGSTFLRLNAPGSPELGAALRAWAWVVPLTGANLVISAALSLLEGSGGVAQVATARLLQAAAGSLALWFVLAHGDGLGALVAQAALSLATGAAWLAFIHRGFFIDLLKGSRTAAGLDWWREVWPFQWRIAVSWGSGYLIAQLFTPLLFASQGPVAAGRMGLTLQICGALNLLALAWISAEVPTYGRLMARQEGAAAERLFLRSLLRSAAVLLALVLLMLAVVAALEHAASSLPQRVLPLPLLAWAGLVTLANHVVFSEAMLLRARREEPFMVQSVCTGLATAGLSLLWIPGHGLHGAVAAYAIATLLIALPGGTAIYLRKRRHWRAPVQPPSCRMPS
jgi:O-antigen/teichoic acid export membrane protein